MVSGDKMAAVKSWKMCYLIRDHILSALSVSARCILYLTFLVYLAHLKVLVFLIKNLPEVTKLSFQTDLKLSAGVEMLLMTISSW